MPIAPPVSTPCPRRPRPYRIVFCAGTVASAPAATRRPRPRFVGCRCGAHKVWCLHWRWLHLACPDLPLLSYRRALIPPSNDEQTRQRRQQQRQQRQQRRRQKKYHLCHRSSSSCATQTNPEFLQTLGPAQWPYMVAIDLTNPGASHSGSLSDYTGGHASTSSPRPRPTLPRYPPPQPPPAPSRRTSTPSCS